MAGTSRSGRKPKPTALKVVQGNPGKRKLNASEPEVAKFSAAPEPPEWMPEIAREQWGRVADWLVGAGILSNTDLVNLEAYCMAYSHWREANEHVRINGQTLENPSTGALYKNPMMTVINESSRQMVTYGSALGLDPASRSRLSGGGRKDDDNPFAQLLSGQRK